jgi:RHS repeat-associated protein
MQTGYCEAGVYPTVPTAERIGIARDTDNGQPTFIGREESGVVRERRRLWIGRFDVQWDDFADAGLLYMHARHYSLEFGRFLQPDPSAMEDNLYGYAGNSPVTKVDPDGTDTWWNGGPGWSKRIGKAVVELPAWYGQQCSSSGQSAAGLSPRLSVYRLSELA